MSHKAETTVFGYDSSVLYSGIMSSSSAQSPTASASPSTQLKCTTGSPGTRFDSEVAHNAGQTNKPSSLRLRSCLSCRNRKVRCNKELPCSTCSRGFVPCVYPMGRAPFRKPPRSSATQSGTLRPSEKELMERMGKLEDIISKLSDAAKIVPANQSSSTVHFQHNATEKQSPGPDSRPTSPFEDLPGASSGQGFIGPHLGRDASAVHQHAPQTTTRPDSQNRFGRLVLHDQSGGKRYISDAFLAQLDDKVLSSSTHSPLGSIPLIL